MVIVSLFDRSGNIVKPWLEDGHTCHTVDILPAMHDGQSITHHMQDVRDFAIQSPIQPDLVFAFPPCTHLASSGAHAWKRKGDKKLQEALELVEYARRYAAMSGAPLVLENPIGRLSTLWRKPDYIYHPFHYANLWPDDTYSKATCLWIENDYGLLTLPKRDTFINDIEPDRLKVHFMHSATRAVIASITPMGFSIAFYNTNKENVRLITDIYRK